jgi:hypothetical protein
MASRTQIRLGQITGSFGDFDGGIIDTLGVSDTALAAIPVTSGSLTDVLSVMASSIKRIAGGLPAKAFTAVPASTLEDAGGTARIDYIDAAPVNIRDEAGNVALAIGGADATDKTAVFSGDLVRGDTTLQDGQLDHGSGDFTIDVAGNIALDADGGVVTLQDGGVARGALDYSTQHLVLSASTQDKDIIFMVNDGGVMKAALTLDGSAAGVATFNDDIIIKDAGTIGNTSVADVMTLASTGIVTFKDDLLLKNDATIGTAGVADTLLLNGSGDVTVKRDANITRNLTVTGDLTVNGTTATVDTTNLKVADKVILLGSGSAAANSQGGIAITSGSNTASQAMVFGRVANDTWGVGRKDVQDGVVTTLADMALINLRANKLELDGANDRLFVNTDLTIDAAADIVLDAGGAHVKPAADDGAALGEAGTAFSDLFLASGGVVNFNSSDVTLTHAANLLTVAGGELRMNAAQKVEFGGASDFIHLDTDLKVIAGADIVLDPSGNNVVPGSDGADSLGSDALRWNRIHVNRVSGSGGTPIQLERNGSQQILKGRSGNISIKNAAPHIPNNSGLIGFIDTHFTGSTFTGASGGSALAIANDVSEYNTFVSNFGSVSIINAINAARAGTSGAGKFSAEQSARVLAGAAVTVGSGYTRAGVPEAERKSLIDVFVNGQLLLSGASGSEDYFLSSDTQIKFNFDLEVDDVLTVIVR